MSSAKTSCGNLGYIWPNTNSKPLMRHWRTHWTILHVSYWCYKGNHISFSYSLHVFHSNIQDCPLPAEKYGVSGWCKLQLHWGAGALCNFCKGIKLALIMHSFIISDGVTSREIVSWLMKTNSNIQEVKGSKHQKSGFHFFWKSSDGDCRVAWWNTTSIQNGFKLSKPPNHYLTESQSTTCQRWPIMLLVLSIFFSVWSTHTIQWQRIWPLISIVSFIYTLIWKQKQTSCF